MSLQLWVFLAVKLPFRLRPVAAIHRCVLLSDHGSRKLKTRSGPQTTFSRDCTERT